jgi:thiosulfate/3-mercaptopyruvate sulfurtransferase
LLVQADELAASIDHPDLVIVDCRFSLLEPEAGKKAWLEGHIPGAYYADLDQDLAGPITMTSGRHPLPDPEAFASLLGSWGVTPETHVVAYDAAGGAVAARLWWLLRWVGHEHVTLLDGGYPAWQDQKLPVSTDHPVQQQGSYPVEPGGMPVVSTAEVEEGLQDGSLVLLDAREAERFAGKAEPIDSKAGHILSSHNRPFRTNLDALGRFRGAADLQESFSELLSDKDRQLVSMCGSGVTACQNIFAIQLASDNGDEVAVPALYVGSWSEWIRSTDRPVETITITVN